MPVTRRMTRNRNDDDASSSKKSIKACDNNSEGPWSHLNPDVLSLVMIKLGVIELFAVSMVCKPWRSLALANMNMCMASKPPMLMHISTRGGNKDKEYCLEDSEGRKIKTIVPHSAGRLFVGIACGYLMLFRRKTKDFWLVNLITRHELQFPSAPFAFRENINFTGVLVFSPSISKWVFVVLDTVYGKIWVSIEGKGSWERVSSPFQINNINFFKKKIYSICSDTNSSKVRHLREFTLNPRPKWTLLETKNSLSEDLLSPKIVCSGENLYVMEGLSVDGLYDVREVDFGKMEWERFKDTKAENVFFLSNQNYRAAVKPDSWADPRAQQQGRCNVTHESGHGTFFTSGKGYSWYFPHQSVNDNVLDES